MRIAMLVARPPGDCDRGHRPPFPPCPPASITMRGIFPISGRPRLS